MRIDLSNLEMIKSFAYLQIYQRQLQSWDKEDIGFDNRNRNWSKQQTFEAEYLQSLSLSISRFISILKEELEIILQI
jgi:hypothetical protein